MKKLNKLGGHAFICLTVIGLVLVTIKWFNCIELFTLIMDEPLTCCFHIVIKFDTGNVIGSISLSTKLRNLTTIPI